ncbi:sodium/proton antiporter (NhaD family) [Rhodopseudomonas faecalis]|uniref:Sodium/proton antiporter (NhaD family) n=1 Tax=Rhodopseudomonas faecalis TaxID=99655 RepID=A0A318TEP7_9BRAD|nr:sodium:proton antiporter NhaD [Rhodopseudomonas faecalis]PYF03096.1 sodium/proton antiporter (NhaD family) [Rhodopseudomonas faecalis]
MQIATIAIFVAAYLAIALEHPLGINKSASALFGAGLLWTVYALSGHDHSAVIHELDQSVAAAAQIIFFLMGAMIIVEVIDAHDGFEIITSQIRTNRLTVLLWQVGLVTFFLSAVLDNLTTTIVMLSLVRKLLSERKDRLIFAANIVIAANAGGAWSPIGDVTTTMLWIGGQITSLAILQGLFLASFVNLLVPLALMTRQLRGQTFRVSVDAEPVTSSPAAAFERKLVFSLGIGILTLVPAFKAVTGLPPFMGILFGLGLLWVTSEIVHRHKDQDAKQRLTLVNALTRIDLSAVMFFLGILLAVATLEHAGLLAALAKWLDQVVGRQDIIVLLLGLLSAVVDNVPLVAASMGMYSLALYPPDSFLWHFIAYCAGTGGSILIIGSAAGVAAMGIERIDFFWYVRRISLLALVGYGAGAAVYIAQFKLLY